MPHNHVQKIAVLTPPPPASPLGHDPGDRMKIMSKMFCISVFVRSHKKFGLKIFEIDLVIEI